MQPHGGLSELGSRAAGWRRHVAIARCGCGLRPSLRPSRRKPSSTSVSPRRARSPPLPVSLDSPGGIGSTPRMSQSVRQRTIATKEMLRKSRHRSLSRRRPLWCPRLATGFELAVVAQKRWHAALRL